jgi:hypothetical protein
MERCRICGARLFEGATHCARCLTPIAPTKEEVAEAAIDVAAASGRWHDPRLQTQGWRADERHTAPSAPAVYSRVRAGALSFSLPVKIALSILVVVGVPFFFYEFAGPLALGPIMLWSIIVPPRVLRDLWRRTRVS